MGTQISLIIPTYNRLSSLKRVLPSYLKQKYINEVLIVDDFGCDDLEGYFCRITEQDEKLRYIRLDRHMGLPGARNIGIKKAAGDFVLFGEDDVYFSADYAEKLLDCAYRTGADIIAGRIISLRYGQAKQKTVAKADS